VVRVHFFSEVVRGRVVAEHSYNLYIVLINRDHLLRDLRSARVPLLLGLRSRPVFRRRASLSYWCLRLLLVVDEPRPLDSADVDIRRSLQEIPVRAQVEVLLIVADILDLIADFVVDVVHQDLLLLCLLNPQLHETQGLGDNLPVELELNLLPLDALVLLLDLDREEVHHIVALLDLLQLLGELVLQEADGLQTVVEL